MKQSSKGEEAEKVQVTFNPSQLELIDKYKGVFGSTRAEIVRHIVANWLYENEIRKGK